MGEVLLTVAGGVFALATLALILWGDHSRVQPLSDDEDLEDE